ncbi:ABC transporter ATP-binding protein/permease [Candidatus Pelagibacter bacterium]|nr:ABC transporter ATP-binding protein [Candidatus Pelagibacter bacterium]MDA8844879.1 ABC transporter ATP-binding protein/permease [Candidatus Pelagibacter bacterium]
MQKFKKLFFLLSSKDRKSAHLLLVMIIIMALLDMIGVASILPFIAVLSNPSLIETNAILNTIFKNSNMLGVENNQEFIFLLGIFVFVLLIISLTFKSFTVYLQSRFAQMCEYSISTRLIKGYLYQNYDWFLSRHSADLGKNILSEVNQIVSMGINTMMDLMARSITTITLIALLSVVNLKLTLIIGLTFGCAYLLIFLFVSRYLTRIGKDRLRNNQLRFTAISEAFGAVKELKVGGLEETYIKSFSFSALILAKTQATNSVIAQLPRFILEAIAFGGILLLILYKMSQVDSFNNILPIISLYIFAGYRLMPAVQQIYTSFTRLTYIGSTLDTLYNDLKSLKPLNKNQEVLFFNKSITLNNIFYSYPNSSRTALEAISLNIPVKSTIGLIGATGSGKTTLIDVILGLLKPQKGTLEVDEKIITEQNSRSWQRSIGYVPQHIFLVDDSIAANIALGINDKDIDQDLVEKVSKIANLHEFVVNELSEKYQTHIGERGVRLSGGQRQRIGIARALYHNPKLLILDEATNALDNITEKKVMENIYKLSKEITIIIIAHRLDTIENCDIIYKLYEGKQIKQKSYSELINLKV